MFSRKLTAYMFYALWAISFAPKSYSNGINPPRPSGSRLMTVTCTNRLDGVSQEIFRSHFMVGSNKIENITFFLDDALEEVGIDMIGTITLSTNVVDADGFIDCLLTFRWDEEGTTSKMQIQLDDTPLSVTGFDAAGERVTIDVITCESLSLSFSRRLKDHPGKKAKK